MSKLKKILIPIDFSDAAQSAVDYAVHFVEEQELIEIVLLHVSSEESYSTGEVEDKLTALRKQLGAHHSISCSSVHKSGELIVEIAKVQEDIKSDLIIMGTKGAVGSGEETNTSKLVIEVDCSVLVIPEKNVNYQIKNIALALGKNEIDDTFSLSTMHGIARKFGAKIHILTIRREHDEETKDKNEDVLEYYFETLDYQFAFPENTDIEKGIFDYVKENNIDMLAILPRNHAKKTKPSEGRLTELLTLHTELPLLTID